MDNGEIDFSGVDLGNSLGDDMIVVNEAEGKSSIKQPDTIDLADNKSTNDENLNKTEKKSEKELEDLIEVIETSNENIKPNNPSQQDHGDSPSTSSLVTLAKALVEEGVITELPEEFGGKVDDLFSLINSEIDNKTTKWVKSLPKPIIDLIENYQEGVPLDRIIQTKSKQIEYGGITDEVLSENVELQKYLIKQDLQNRGHSEAKILKRLKVFEDSEVLEDEATDALTALKQLETYNQSELKKKAKENRELQENMNKKTLEDIKNAVDTSNEIIPGIALSKKAKDKLYDSLTNIVDNSPEGQPMNAVMAKRAQDPLKFELTLHYLTNLGVFDGDFSKITNVQTSSAVSKLKKQLESTSSGFAGKNPNIPRTEETESFLNSMKQFSNDI
jgi:hypothetical protein